MTVTIASMRTVDTHDRSTLRAPAPAGPAPATMARSGAVRALTREESPVHPRKIIRDFIGIAGSQYLVRLLLMARGVIAARLLGPASFGLWNGLSLLMDYGTQSQLGTLQGLDQTVPPRIVEGDTRGLTRIKRAGLFNLLVFGLGFTALCAVYFLRSPGLVRSFWGEGGLTLACLTAVLINVSYYHNSILRSHGDVGSVSAWTLIQGLIGAVLGVALIPRLGAWGLLYGWLAGTLVALAYVRFRGGRFVPLAPAVSPDSRLLLTVGFPMFVYVVLNFVMRSLDRLVILRFLGIESLGFYQLAVMAINMLLYLPDSLAYVIYPRILARYHEAGSDPEAVREPIERAMRFVSLLLPLFCAVAYLAADDAVLWILPKYRAGVPSLRILCFGAAALGLGSLSSVVLMTLRRQAVLIPVAVTTTLVGGGLMIAAARFGFGIRGVAWVTLATYAAHSAAMLWFTFGGLGERPWRRLLYVTRLFAPLAIAILLAFVCNTFLPWGNEIGFIAVARLALGVALFLAIYLAVAVPLARGIGIAQLALDFRLPGFARLRAMFRP
jgi:O-antigen/teichoic acid export membrane protein